MVQSEIKIELRTTWVMLMITFFAWIKSKRLLKMFDNAIFARMYVNGKLSEELRLPINQILKDYERKA